MAFSVDDLLNPAPAGTAVADEMDHESSEVALAPELFQNNDIDLATLAANAASTLDNHVAASVLDSATDPPILKHEGTESEAGASQYPIDGLMDSVVAATDGDAMDVDNQSLARSPSVEKKSAKPRKRHDPDAEPRSSIHSSKNEGQHTDKRYLCYVCHKLFTRRRSVRDHIAKIHGSKSFEPLKSLEITVDPTTGEPDEPLEDIIARGPPTAPDKPSKPKKEKAKIESTDNNADQTPSLAEDAPEGVVERELDLGDFPDEGRAGSPEHFTPAKKAQGTPSRDGKALTKASPEPGTFAPPPLPQLIGKKRPASEMSKPLPAVATKKGTAKPKSATNANKKPRLTESDSVSDRSTPLRSPSATPIASGRMPSSKLKKQLSAATSPASSRVASVEPESPSESAADTPGSSNDDGEIFCICRKGDNHTWMIACDGGCDEWFHGKCVNIRERDGDLIDKYICPKCFRDDLMTTWKRMCRRQDCRRPAKVFQDPPSKYCSKECGRMFFVELLRRGDPYIDTTRNDQHVVNSNRSKKLRKKRKTTERRDKRHAPKSFAAVNGDAVEDSESRLATPAYSEDEKTEYETDSSADEDELPNRGGPLRAGEVRALAESCKSLDEWRSLGRKPATPPPEEEVKMIDAVYDDFETNKLKEIESQKAENTRQLTILDAKEKLLEAIKARSTGIADEVKKANPKQKDICGFDPRLGWNEDIFVLWYNEKGGKEILEADQPRIGLPETPTLKTETSQFVNGIHGDSDDENSDGKPTKKGGVCIKNKCGRHRNWAKSQLAEIRFEQDVVKRNVRKTEELEKGIKDRASLRALEIQQPAGLAAGLVA